VQDHHAYVAMVQAQAQADYTRQQRRTTISNPSIQQLGGTGEYMWNMPTSMPPQETAATEKQARNDDTAFDNGSDLLIAHASCP
jgi:hypothetical protein